MNQIINVNELYKAALQIEKIGEAFYKKYAEKSASEDIKMTFEFLAAREQTHYRRFKDLMEALGPQESAKAASEKNQDRLSQMIKDMIFNADRSVDKMISLAKDMQAALRSALGLEKDSIAYYQMILPDLDTRAQKEVGKIITEEMVHEQIIENMLENLP